MTETSSSSGGAQRRQGRSRSRLLCTLVVLLAAGGSVGAFADESSAPPGASNAALQTTDGGQPAAPALQGSVKVTEKSALVALKSIGEVVHKLKRSSAELFAECTRHEVELIDEPDIIGSTVIDIPISYDMGVTLPARKKWVDFYMGQLGQLIPLLEDEYVAMRIPDDKEQLAQPYVSDLRGCMKDIDAHYANLISMAKASPYNQQRMAGECQGIDGDIKKIHEDQKRIYHVVKERDKDK